MDWTEALEIEIGRRGHERWRVLCDESNPDHKMHRRSLVELVTGIPEPEVTFEQLEAIRIANEALPPEQRKSGCCS